jgi:hypothetical protein
MKYSNYSIWIDKTILIVVFLVSNLLFLIGLGSNILASLNSNMSPNWLTIPFLLMILAATAIIVIIPQKDFLKFKFYFYPSLGAVLFLSSLFANVFWHRKLTDVLPTALCGIIFFTSAITSKNTKEK